MSLREDHLFAKALQRSMKLTGTSQAEIARQCDVSRATVHSWLNGAEPAEHNFKKLVVLFPELGEFAR